ncbi:MAG: hypothetical protein PHO37_16315 [Kiritimatiellae bacterium]|nr:hypothetical protein [Kiritimatiellia bacterium]
MTEENLNGAVPPKVTPGAPRPITVRLKPVAPKSETQRAAEAEAKEQQTAEPMETVITAIPGRTARVPIPALEGLDDDDKPKGVATSATVKLRPVRVPGETSQPPFTAASDAHKPGSNPLPPGPKPPSEAQVQAAKSKTSRISLEAAIGVAPDGPMSGGSPKTIRLRRPAKLDGTGAAPSATESDGLPRAKSRTAPIGKTSRIPDGALPDQADDSSATVTQKKTLKIKRKGGAPAAEDADFPEGVELTPISDLSHLPESGGAFTVVAGIAAILAAIVMLLLTVCMGAQAIGPAAGKNNLATIRLGNMELPWIGKITR